MTTTDIKVGPENSIIDKNKNLDYDGGEIKDEILKASEIIVTYAYSSVEDVDEMTVTYNRGVSIGYNDNFMFIYYIKDSDDESYNQISMDIIPKDHVLSVEVDDFLAIQDQL